MTKAIIFDCFGVLVRGSLEGFIDEHLSHDQKLVHRAHELNDQASLALITYDEQIEEFARMAELSVENTHVEMDHNPRNRALLSYIREELKDTYKLGFLSNASANWLDELLLQDDLALFDDFVLSYAVKMTKPDKRIFELSAQNLKVSPHECVFIDDIERYCEGAKIAGMEAIHYQNFGQMKSELTKLLNHTDSNK